MGSSVEEAPLATRLLMPFAGGLLAGGTGSFGRVLTGDEVVGGAVGGAGI